MTIYLWENNRVTPSLASIPKIIKFLDYDPYGTVPMSLADKIRDYRRLHGLSQKKLAGLLEIDQTTLAGWERGENQPIKRNLEKILTFVTSYPSSISGPEEEHEL